MNNILESANIAEVVTAWGDVLDLIKEENFDYLIYPDQAIWKVLRRALVNEIRIEWDRQTITGDPEAEADELIKILAQNWKARG